MVSFIKLTLLALASTSVASPIQARQGELGVVAEIVETADAIFNLIKDVFDYIVNINDRRRTAESNFAQSLVGTLAAKYPSKNVMMFHNQNCHYNFINGAHSHYELDIGFGMTWGYEVWVFDSGTFDLAGDGGYINWCFQGNWVRNGNHVNFYTINTAPSAEKKLAITGINSSSSMSMSMPALVFDFAAKHNNTNSKLSIHQALHKPVTYLPAPAPAKPLIAPLHPTNTKIGSNDGQYFVQCKSQGNDTVSQGVAYYKDLVPGQNAGQKPDAFAWLSQVHEGDSGENSSSSSSVHEDWALPVGAVEFEETQNSVHWQIFGNAVTDTVAFDQTCGVADNGNEHFWIYKDQGKQLFETDQYICDSLYYAF